MNKGFTLLETVFVVALSAFLLFAIQTLYLSFTRLESEESAEYSARGSAVHTLRAVESMVFPANRILASHTFSTGTYTTNSETLVVRIPSVTSTGAIIAGVYDYAVLYQSGASALSRLEAGQGSARQTRERTVGTPLADLTFSYDNADVTNATSVTASISAFANEGHGSASVVLEETFRARNLTL
jgi:type II secretory pathway pseudopilin PulG